MAANPLWTGIVCPGHALQAILRLMPAEFPAGTALAVFEAGSRRSRIIARNRAAAALGIHRGQALADALAIVPNLEPLKRSRDAEDRMFEEIALTAYRYSDRVAITGDGVVLEVGGSRRLHGRLEALLDALAEELQTTGVKACMGTAPVPAAACLLARQRRQVFDAGALRRELADWPLHRLALSPGEHEKLAGLGLKRICDVLALPGFERERRLGRSINLHLDQLHGRTPTPLVCWRPQEAFRQRLELPVATARTDALLFALNRVLAHLGRWLQVRDRALTGLHVELHPENDAPSIAFEAALAQAGFRRERLLEILRLKLETLHPASAVEALTVRADSTAEHRPPQPDLWTGANGGDAWPALLDRLRAKVGDEGLCGIAPCADHRPEKAWRWTPPGEADIVAEAPPRPNWLLPEPRPCRVEDLDLVDGPERIESGWWDGDDCRRDYWTAHDRHGNRLWVFREYKPRAGWFVHGLFG